MSLLKQERSHCLARIPAHVEFLGRDDSLRPRKLETHALHPHLASIDVAPHVAERVAGLQRNLTNSKCAPRLSEEPLPQQLGSNECVENKIPSGRKRSLHHHFAIS